MLNVVVCFCEPLCFHVLSANKQTFQLGDFFFPEKKNALGSEIGIQLQFLGQIKSCAVNGKKLKHESRAF